MATHGQAHPITLGGNEYLAGGQWSKRVPIELLKRSGPYEGLTPASALFLAALASLNPQKYFSKSRLCKAAGQELNAARKKVIPQLISQGFLVETPTTWTINLKVSELQTKTESQEEQPKKEKEEKAEQPQQPATRQKPAPPIKRDSSLAATSTSSSNTDSEHFAEIWNLANGKGLMAQAVLADFTPTVLQNIDTISEQLLLDADVLVRECVANADLVDYWKSAKQKPDYIFNPKFIQNHKTACAVALEANRISWDDYLDAMIDNYNEGLSVGENSFGEMSDLRLKADESGLAHVRRFHSEMNNVNFYGMNRQAKKHMICKDTQDENIHRRALIDFCKKVGWISAYRRSQGDDEIHQPFIQFIETYRVLEDKRDIRFPAGV